MLTAQSGPDHQKLFRVEVRIPDGRGGSRALGESEGSTKKQAQQQAARIAVERLLAEQASALKTTGEILVQASKADKERTAAGVTP